MDPWILLHGHPLCLQCSVGDTCSPKPTLNRAGGCSPVPLKQMKYCSPNFRDNAGHWIVTKFPCLSSNPLPVESRLGPDRTEGSPWPASLLYGIWCSSEAASFGILWKGRNFGPSGGHLFQWIEGRTARAPWMQEEPMQLPPLLLYPLQEAWLEDKKPKMAWGKIRVWSIWLRDGWKIGTSACRHSWDQVRRNTDFVASCEMTPTSPVQELDARKSNAQQIPMGIKLFRMSHVTSTKRHCSKQFSGLIVLTFLEAEDITNRADELMKNKKIQEKKYWWI